jgi:hypothetical protein
MKQYGLSLASLPNWVLAKRTLFAVNDTEIKTYRTQQDKPVGVCELRPSAQGSA